MIATTRIGPAGSSQADKAILIRAVYRQVLGYQYVMESERLDWG